MTVEYVKRNGLGSGETLDLAHTGAVTAHEHSSYNSARPRAQSHSPPALKRPAIKSGVLSQSASRQSKAQPGTWLPIEPDKQTEHSRRRLGNETTVDRAAAGSHINRDMDIRHKKGSLGATRPTFGLPRGKRAWSGRSGQPGKLAAIDTGEAARNSWTGDLGRINKPRDRLRLGAGSNVFDLVMSGGWNDE